MLIFKLCLTLSSSLVMLFVLLTLLLQLLKNFKLLLELHAVSSHLTALRQRRQSGHRWRSYVSTGGTGDDGWCLRAISLHCKVLKCILVISSAHILANLSLILSEICCRRCLLLLELGIDSLVKHVLLELRLHVEIRGSCSPCLLEI